MPARNASWDHDGRGLAVHAALLPGEIGVALHPVLAAHSRAAEALPQLMASPPV